MYIIYKVYCKNTKKYYIGKTTMSLSIRKYRHEQFARLNNTKTKFTKALCKYGFDAFIWTIIDKTNTLKKLNKLEKQYIKHFNSYTNGYNSTYGGDGGNTIINQKIHSNKIKLGLSKLSKHSKSLDWYIYDNVGNEFITQNGLSDFCRKNNLCLSSMHNIINGRKKKLWHKTYTIFRYKPIDSELQYRLSTYNMPAYVCTIKTKKQLSKTHTLYPNLTSRKIQNLLKKGYTRKDIANLFCCSYHTVRRRQFNISRIQSN